MWRAKASQSCHDGARGVGWQGWGVAVGVVVEPVGDGAVAEFFVDAPGVDLLDDGCPVGVVEGDPGRGRGVVTLGSGSAEANDPT